MTSKDIVRATIEHSKPHRVAKTFSESDIKGSCYSVKTYATPWKKVNGDRWEMLDEWGNLWARIDSTTKGEVVRGVLENDTSIEDYRLPYFGNENDYLSALKTKQEYPDKWVFGFMPGFTFNIARKLYKLENYLVKLMLEPEEIHLLHDKIDKMLSDMIINYGKIGMDGIFFPEDWGTQSQTLISPELWRSEFYPRYVKLCSIAHENKMNVMMHSCGAIGAIIPGLMEAGVDVLQFDQPGLHGIDNLAGYQKKGRITFWCPVDIQKTLQSKDEYEIRKQARELIEKLWMPEGGFIAGYYEGNSAIGLDPKWQKIACDEFISLGTR